MIPSDDSPHPSSVSSLHVVQAGDGPAVALAHGAGGGVELNFGGVIGALRHDRTLIGVNYPGSGESPRSTAPLTLDGLADAVVEAMVSAGHERFPVLGLSLGAAVAVTAAVRHPDRVTGLVLTVGMARADAQVAGFNQVWQRLDELGEIETLAAFLVHLASPLTLAAMTAEQRQRAVRLTQASYPSGAVDQGTLAASVDIEHLLPGVQVPTLVVVAGQDRIILPSTTRSLARGITGSEVVEYPAAGHIFTPDEQERWIADVAAFLRRHDL